MMIEATKTKSEEITRKRTWYSKLPEVTTPALNREKDMLSACEASQRVRIVWGRVALLIGKDEIELSEKSSNEMGSPHSQVFSQTVLSVTKPWTMNIFIYLH
jgi:hypothetical protein